MPLYQHQKDGLLYLVNNWNQDKGSILAFDMGLGKTITDICYYKILKDAGKIDSWLVVVPANLIGQWEEEILKTLKVKPHIYHGQKRKEKPEHRDIVITSYDLLKKDKTWLDVVFNLGEYKLTCDEAHEYLKNIDSGRTHSVLDLSPKTTTLLTGTPIANKPEDMFSLTCLVYPGVQKFERHWYEKFIDMGTRPVKVTRKNGATFWIERDYIKGYKNIPQLHEFLKDIMLRKTKDECLDLPKKNVIYKRYDCTGLKYNRLEKLLIEEEAQGMQAATQLRKLLSGSLYDEFDKKIDKYLVLKGLLDQSSGRKIVWCAFISTVELLSEQLEKEGYRVFKHTGEMSRKQKEASIDQFKETDDSILVATIQSAGKGYNLTECNEAIFYETTLVQSQNEQAEDRIYRIGQEKPVTIAYLYGKRTIEEGIKRLLQNKNNVNQAVIDGKFKNLDEVYKASFSLRRL